MPFNNDDETGIVYVWIGSKADNEESHLIEEIAEEMFNTVRHSYIEEKMIFHEI